MVGFPFSAYVSRDEQPAALFEPDYSSMVDCEKSSINADQLRFGVFADWAALPAGADAFVLPSEMQGFAWDEDGEAFNDPDWPTAAYTGAIQGSSISPTSLGDMNDDTDDDVLFSTAGEVMSFGSDGQPPLGSDFPISLPDGVLADGGFSIADIDNDEVVEIVFGTSDGKLHCWELDDCVEGYAPWPQFQHDHGRTGVLE